ncbi:MAG TPA: FGGY family carbohydrate kinase [Saprospiraceae bacterium]|nr:FGGY family carbohydrate kinase [Saprospiraceae bacterium]
MYLLGYDIGSSSIKAALVDTITGKIAGTAQHPEREMEIIALHPDWAEQHPDDWWEAVCAATRKLLEKTRVHPNDIAAIGISYQMHGLVLVGKKGEVLRPSIIWCDSRAVGIGNQAFEKIGKDYCLERYLNSPGNFTASKLRWVRENEPDIFSEIDKFMLPGDYIAFRMTGEICSTATGLSEGVLWDFIDNSFAKSLLEYYEIPEKMLPDVAPVFSIQGKMTAHAAAALGLAPGIPVGYRAGDQPNNALSLNVLRPGEVAATGGTSGVVYAVAKQPMFDAQQRVNSFAHVNYTAAHPLTGVLLCINGTGSQYRWMRQHIGDPGLGYNEMEQLAASAGIGADGICILPFGNGAERMLGNRVVGSRISGLNFNRHEKRHLYRAALEGIAFSFVYGVEVLQQMGISVRVLRAGNDNLFQSAIFANTISTLIDAEIELIATTGAVGAAKAAGVSVGIYKSVEEAMANVEVAGRYEPGEEKETLVEAYEKWRRELKQVLQTLEK